MAGVRIGDLVFGVTIDANAAQKQIDAFAASSKKALEAAGNAVAKTFSAAIGAAVVGMSALTVATLNAGVAYNTLGQSATAAFSTIYGSAQAAYDILYDISLLDLTTPFRGDALVRTTRLLAGFGVAQQDVIGITRALSEATAAMGLGSDALERMALAFGQIQSRGKLAGDEARQLANYGVDAYGLLADKLGLTVAEVRKLGEESKLTADFVLPTLVDAITERFGGATEALFNTFAGQVEGLRSIMQGVGSALIDPLIGFTGGGALVEGINLIRTALLQFVTVTEDGSFQLAGALEPLAGIMDNIADAVLVVSQAFAGWLDGLDDNSLTNLVSELSGLEPLLAGIAVASVGAFASVIPIIGGFVSGIGVATAAIVAFVAASETIRDASVDGFNRLMDAAEPLIPVIKDFGVAFVDVLEDVIPAAINASVSAFEALEPILEVILQVGTELLQVLGPLLADALNTLADVFGLLGSVVSVVGPETALFVASIAAIGPAALASVAGVTALAAAIAGLSATKALQAGTGSQSDREAYLTGDVGIFERPFQVAAQLGNDISYALSEADGLKETLIEIGKIPLGLTSREGTDRLRETVELVQILNAAVAGGRAFAEASARGGDSWDEFTAKLKLSGLTALEVTAALAEYQRVLAVIQAENIDAARQVDSFEAADMFTRRLNAALEGTDGALTLVNDDLEDTDVLLRELAQAADEAWDALSQFSQFDSAASAINDFFLGLPDLGKQFTEALDTDGIFGDLKLDRAQRDLETSLVETITAAAKASGMSLAQLENLFNEQGLTAVMNELGIAAQETVKKIDPIVEQYKMLDASAGDLQDAIRELEDQRTTRIRAEIDQLEMALRDAENAAENARQKLIDLFTGGYDSGPQKLIDDLIGNLDGIGSQIEDALRVGGALGDAGIRSALGDFNSQIAAIFQSGLENGLSAQQISDMLGPVGAALQQVLGFGADRISSLDWTSGITPEAASRLAAALQTALGASGGLSAAVGAVFDAEAQVDSIQAALDAKRAELDLDVVFSPAQVQAKLDELNPPLVDVVPTISDEAVDEIWQGIQDAFDSDELKALLDEANLAQQAIDVAEATTLYFQSELVFDPTQVQIAGQLVSAEFYAAFMAQMEAMRDQQAQAAGFPNYASMQASLGPAVANATLGGTAGIPPIQFNSNVQVNGAQSPIATASEITAANSAAAGAGGTISSSLTRIYGPTGTVGGARS